MPVTRVHQLNHLLYENELSQSPINLLVKGTESIQSIFFLEKNETIQIKQLNRVDWYTSLHIMFYFIRQIS